MQVFTAQLHEVGENHVTVISLACLSGLGAKLVTDLCFFIWREEVGDLTRVEEVVDVFEE